MISTPRPRTPIVVSAALAAAVAGSSLLGASASSSNAANNPGNNSNSGAIAARADADALLCETPPAVQAVRDASASVTAANTASARSAATLANLTAAADRAADTLAAAQADASRANAARVTADRDTKTARLSRDRAAAAVRSAKNHRVSASAMRRVQGQLSGTTAAYNASLSRLTTAKSAATTANARLVSAKSANAAAVAAQQSTAALHQNNLATASRYSQNLAKAREAQAEAPVRIITQNIHWATGPALDRPQLLNLCAEAADFILVQEAKNVRLLDFLPNALATNQDTRDQGRAGSAVIWRKPEAYAAPSTRVGAVTPREAKMGVNARRSRIKMQDRYISYVDTSIGGKPTRILSVHYPPYRFRKTWGEMHSSLRRVIAERPKGSAWIVGGDMNQRPASVARALGGTAYGVRIDGLVLSKDLRGENMTPLEYGRSIRATDHPGVLLEVSRR